MACRAPIKTTEAARSRAYRRALRHQCLTAYGHRCFCCGEYRSEFLTIDHPLNDGAACRRAPSNGKASIGGGTRYYAKLRREGFPPRVRLACWSCNAARGFFGYCPHEYQERLGETHV